MPLWKLFYHIVWATRGREPLLGGGVEGVVLSAIRKKAVELGARVYALNGAGDHVHLVAAIPPSVSLSKFVGQVKAVSSFSVNQWRLLEEKFAWQKEYSVFSLDWKRLGTVIDYVRRQKEHHRDGTVVAIFERTEGE